MTTKGVARLAPLTCSRESGLARDRTIDLVEHTRAELHVVHVVHVALVSPWTNPAILNRDQVDRIRTEAQEALADDVRLLRERGLDPRDRVRFARAADEILRLREEVDADLIAYLLLSRIIPLVCSSRAQKKSKAEGGDESEQYFLGGRNFLWPFVGLSLIATNMSGATFVGLVGAAYDQGISRFAYEWMTTVILVVIIFFILPFYLRWTTNQLVVQRSLGAKNLDHGRWGALLAGFLKLSFLFLFIFPGVMALVLYPGLKNPDTVFPTLVLDLLPAGLRGLILAAVIAAITSTVDSILNSSSRIVTMDFVRTLRPNTPRSSLVNIGRIGTMGARVVAVVWSPS